MVDKELLEILVCPKCKSDIEYSADDALIVCQNSECALRYPVRDGIPIMLIDEAVDPLADGDGDS